MRISDWSSDVCSSDLINAEHRNPLFLPGASLSPSLVATGELADLAACDALLVVVPVPFLRAVLADLPAGNAPLIFCSKGLEAHSSASPIDIAREVFSERPQIGRASGREGRCQYV